DSVIVCGLPDTTLVLTVKDVLEPAATVWLAGDTVILKSLVVVVMMTCALVVWVADGPAPVIVKLVVPAEALAAAVRVMVDIWPAETVGGLNDAVTFAGRPDADSVTFCAMPEVTIVDTVYVTLEPAATVWLVGDTDIEKSLVGAPPQVGSLNEATRVLQLNEPSAGMYSCVYQKVQSSVGSMFIELVSPPRPSGAGRGAVAGA